MTTPTLRELFPTVAEYTDGQLRFEGRQAEFERIHTALYNGTHDRASAIAAAFEDGGLAFKNKSDAVHWLVAKDWKATDVFKAHADLAEAADNETLPLNVTFTAFITACRQLRSSLISVKQRAGDELASLDSGRRPWSVHLAGSAADAHAAAGATEALLSVLGTLIRGNKTLEGLVIGALKGEAEYVGLSAYRISRLIQDEDAAAAKAEAQAFFDEHVIVVNV